MSKISQDEMFSSLQLLLMKMNFEFPLTSWLSILDECFLNFNAKVMIPDDSGDHAHLFLIRLFFGGGR